MHTFLWVFIAGAIGLMLFATLQEGLPDELGFLRMTDSGTTIVGEPVPEPGAWRTTLVGGWTVQYTEGALALTRSFRGALSVNGQVFDTPQLGILCHSGNVAVRVDTRLATTGTATTPVGIAGQTQPWDKGSEGFNVIAKDGKAVLSQLLQAKEAAAVEVSYRDLGKQTVYVGTEGLRELVQQMPVACQP